MFIERLARAGLWHTVHLSSFGLFVASSVHGFQAGADRGELAVEWLALTGGTLLLFLVLFRLLAPRRSRAAIRRATVAVT